MIDYDIDKNQRLIRIRICGDSTAAQFARAFSGLLKDPGFDPSFKTLFLVFEDAGLPVTLLQPGADRLFQELAARQKESKWAFVSHSRTHLATLQMATENANLNSVQIRSFKDERSGLRWLNPEAHRNADSGPSGQVNFES